MNWNVYLSGEIHTNWRQRLIEGATAKDLPVLFTSAVTDHPASDAEGVSRIVCNQNHPLKASS